MTSAASNSRSTPLKVLFAFAFGALLAISTVSSMYVYVDWRRDGKAIQSVQSGLWSDPNTWQNGQVPSLQDKTIVHESHKVTFDQNAEELSAVQVRGSLILNDHSVSQTETTAEEPPKEVVSQPIDQPDDQAVNDAPLVTVVPNDEPTAAIAQDASTDLNNDGEFDIFDITIITSPSRWGTDDPQADLNNDGVVDVYDLSLLLS